MKDWQVLGYMGKTRAVRKRQRKEEKMKIGFIGAGNMATAIIGGMIEKKIYVSDQVAASGKDRASLEHLQIKYGIKTTENNGEIMENADVIFLSVKPQVLPQVIAEIGPMAKENQLFVSIAAGKTIDWIEQEFRREIKLVRVMPNTPALVGEGCSGLCANANVTVAEMELVKAIFDCCGSSYEVPEHLMDVVGAVAGSAPAFVFMFMEAMADAAVAGGMPRDLAYKMASQTVLGSGKLMLETQNHPGKLKDMVCSPGGTTICGVKVLEEQGMRGAIMNAIDSCIQKSKKL